VRIDLGCGNAKQPGFLGLDAFPGEQVDHVLDLTTDRYPFDDGTVDEVFSAHFLEHIDEPNHVFREIGRVCRDRARISFWTPYAWTDEAFLYGHLHGITEDLWEQFCVHHRDEYLPMLGGRWQLQTVIYVVEEAVIADLTAHGVDLDFGIRYLKGVVKEIGVEIEFRRDLAVGAIAPMRCTAPSRTGPRRSMTEPAVAGAPRSTTARVVRKVKSIPGTVRAMAARTR
jgi:SAM-dependent methyltransferase